PPGQDAPPVGLATRKEAIPMTIRWSTPALAAALAALAAGPSAFAGFLGTTNYSASAPPACCAQTNYPAGCPGGTRVVYCDEVRTCYKTVTETVYRQVQETACVPHTETVMKPCRESVSRPVYETACKTVCETVCKPVCEVVMKEC